MNGKKAKKLRRLAVNIAESIANGGKRHILEANPLKIYSELKKIDKTHKQSK